MQVTQSSSGKCWSFSATGWHVTAAGWPTRWDDSSGVDGYDIDQLRADLSRFGFLLGVSDGERLFGGDEQ